MGTPTTRRPSRHTKAKDTIEAFSPVKERLRIDQGFDYESQGLPCPAQAYLDSFESDDSRRNMGYALDIFAAFLSGGKLGRDEIQAWRLTTPSTVTPSPPSVRVIVRSDVHIGPAGASTSATVVERFLTIDSALTSSAPQH